MEQIEICIGTYENLILGYKIQQNVEENEFTLESSFTTDSHRGALRCLAVSGQGVLASSSTDDSIRLHSLKKRREIGSLFQHDGSVNRIRFFKGGHMFSASEDGTICLWKCKNWELLRVLKGHRCHVMSVAIHPSAKLGLSVGSDRTFFTWDLTTGKLAFKRKTEDVVQDILFTQDGQNYILVYQKKIEVCSLEDTSVLQTIKFTSRINDVCFVEENILAIAGDDGKVSVINIISNTEILQETFKGRIRCLDTLSTKMGILLFVTTSSGCIRVCRLDFSEESESIETVLEYESGVRVTCITAYAPLELLKEDPSSIPVKDRRKRKRRAFDDENKEDTKLKEELDECRENLEHPNEVEQDDNDDDDDDEEEEKNESEEEGDDASLSDEFSADDMTEMQPETKKKKIQQLPAEKVKITKKQHEVEKTTKKHKQRKSDDLPQKKKKTS